MRVLLLTNHVNHGGITAYLLNLVSALHGRDGFEYVIASRGGELEGEFKKRGVAHVRIPLSTKCEVSPKVLVSFFNLRPLIKQERIDVLHANTRVTQVLAFLLSQATKKPYLSTCHGYFRPRIFRRIFPCWGQKVIAISDQVQEHLVRDFGVEPARVALIYNGIDATKFVPKEGSAIEQEKRRLGLSLNKKTIGHIGRLSSVKGQKFLILAAEVLCQKRRDVQFLIIGDGDQEPALQELVRQKELAPHVRFCSSVKDTALALSVMDIFVMPSLQEGLGLSLLEAQAMAVPVVASRVGGIPTLVEDRKTGLLCAPQDAGSLARAIEMLLEDQDLAHVLASQARLQAQEKFSLSVMSAKTRQVYENLLCGGP